MEIDFFFMSFLSKPVTNIILLQLQFETFKNFWNRKLKPQTRWTFSNPSQVFYTLSLHQFENKQKYLRFFFIKTRQSNELNIIILQMEKESYKDRQENELEVLKVNQFLKFRLKFCHIFV